MLTSRSLRSCLAGAAGSLLLASTAAAQQGGVAAPCARADVPASARDHCYTVAQALESVQPQLGLVLAGGNPTLGSTSTAGMRLGVTPGSSVTGRLNLVLVQIPDILSEESRGGLQRLEGDNGFPAPALSGTVSIGVIRGSELSPGVAGIGSVDLLGSVSWLPLKALGFSDFRIGNTELAYGVGARVGLLRESFTVPGASVSLMYRRLGEIAYGRVCEAPIGSGVDGGQGYTFASGVCGGSGDPGELTMDLTDWSGRFVVGKQLFGFGLAAGAGYDRFSSDAGLGFRAPSGTVAGTGKYVARARGLDLDNDRFSGFANLTFTSLVTTFALEAGWMQGEEALEGFSSTSDFDPGRGTWFGSLAVRLAL